VRDDTDAYIDPIHSDVPDAVRDTLTAFDKGILHFKIADDRIYCILRGNAPIEDYEGWHGMNPHSGPNDLLIKDLQSDHIRLPPVEKMLEQNIVLHRSIGYRPDSPFHAAAQPLGNLVELKVSLIYPLMTIQKLHSTAYTSCKVAETVLCNMTDVTMANGK
jgi:hypothetical protein